VESSDILVGSNPKKGIGPTAGRKAAAGDFLEKSPMARDNSCGCKQGERPGGGCTCVYPEQGDELPPGANMVVGVYVAQKRKSGRDKWGGSMGIRYFPNSACRGYAYLPDGTPVDIVLNPWGVRR